MRILALETTSALGSAAIALEDKLIDHIELPREQRSAQSLIPTIGELFRRSGWKFKDLDLICLASGPGSFTNLRIGVTVAKLLAYSNDAEVVGLNSLQVIAHRLHEMRQVPDRVVAVIDAQRKQLFSGQFRLANGDTIEEDATLIMDRADWIEALPESCMVTGPGLENLKQQIVDARADITLADDRFWQPTAADITVLGWKRKQADRLDDIWSISPQYYRQSAAEEKFQAES